MYISRAEQLCQLLDGQETADTPQRSRRLSRLCVEGGRRLAAYKIVGLTGGRLKVADADTGRPFVVKVVEKSVGPSASAPGAAAAVLPEGVPHMAPLHQLVETEHAYFLVLHYMGSPLWDTLAGDPEPQRQQPPGPDAASASSASDTASPSSACLL
ncbi:uncharacterized protein LOC119109068 [Pollicipes pollicipes]|uniref:uncharacterized protein LOC119109068 n=1 Tax=Pollicipes pollicipes TaxID=41117 RepID=UPI0018858409|nr:uncharacterized protein LOC119109068 [Pollicipes pollicipes]